MPLCPQVKALLDRGVDVNFGATLPNTPTALCELSGRAWPVAWAEVQALPPAERRLSQLPGPFSTCSPPRLLLPALPSRSLAVEAVKHKQKEVVTLLLSRGARVDPVYLQKMNALHVAARGKANAILGMLLSEPGVASVINDRDQGGRTVL